MASLLPQPGTGWVKSTAVALYLSKIHWMFSLDGLTESCASSSYGMGIATSAKTSEGSQTTSLGGLRHWSGEEFGKGRGVCGGVVLYRRVEGGRRLGRGHPQKSVGLVSLVQS